MLLPPRCFSCGKVVEGYWDKFVSLVVEKKHTERVALDILGFRRECCRRMFLSNIEVIDSLLLYKQTRY